MTTHDFFSDLSFGRSAALPGTGGAGVAARRPMIAVVRIAAARPDSGALERLATAVSAGVAAAGGSTINITILVAPDGTETAVPSSRAARMAKAILADGIEQGLAPHRADGIVCVADSDAGMAAAAMVLGRLDWPGLVIGRRGSAESMALALAVMGLSTLDGEGGERCGRLAVEQVCGEDTARKYITPLSLANAAAVGGATGLHLGAIAAEAGIAFGAQGAAVGMTPDQAVPAVADDARSVIRRLAATGAIRNAPTVSGRSLFAEASWTTAPAASGLHHLKATRRAFDDAQVASVGPIDIIAARHAAAAMGTAHTPSP